MSVSTCMLSFTKNVERKIARLLPLLGSSFRGQSRQGSVQMTPFLLGPGPGQRAGECRDGGIGRSSAIQQGRQDPRRYESERKQQSHVPLNDAFAAGDHREVGGPAMG